MIKFYDLWNNHPGKRSYPCNFQDQCAIRMGIALGESKVDLSSFRGVRCWFGHNPRHILRAQELADWISKKYTIFGIKIVYKRKDHPKMSSDDFYGKKGIVFIKDGWGPTDHIDLWNGYEMKGGETSFLTRGVEIWFWRLS